MKSKKEGQLLLEDYYLYAWVAVSDEKLFKYIKKTLNVRRKYQPEISNSFHFAPSNRRPYPDTTLDWITPLAYALRQPCVNLTGLLLKHGVPVDDVCMKVGEQYWRPIEMICSVPKCAFLVLKRNPSVDFATCDGVSFCQKYNGTPCVSEYIRKKRMLALCFCFTHMGGAWPDLLWIIKNYLL